MKYIEFDRTKPLDFIPIGRIAIDFNPTDMYKPLSQSSNFNKYVGGSSGQYCRRPGSAGLQWWLLRLCVCRPVWGLCGGVFPK